MARTGEWEELAKELGYEGWEDLLRKLYAEMSISEISKRIGISTTAVVNYLKKFNIQTRAKGGPNGNASQRHKLFLLDQRIVMALSLNDLAKITGASKSVCYHYRAVSRGAKDGVLHNQPSEGTSEVRDVESKAFGAAAGQE